MSTTDYKLKSTFVCMGNICRSLAEGVFLSFTATKSNGQSLFDSAGTFRLPCW